MGNISLAIMKFVSIAIVAAALVVCAAALHPDHLAEDVYQSMWEDFKSTHEKEYTSAEEPFRFLIFKDNVDQINRHNKEFSAGKQSFTMGVTQFADLTKHEFQAYPELQALAGSQVWPRAHLLWVCCRPPHVCQLGHQGCRDRRQEPGPVRFVLGFLDLCRY